MSTIALRSRRVAAACRIAAVMAGLSAVLPASAALSSFASRAALAGTDAISWGQLGADFTEITSLPAAVSSSNGAAATVDNGSGSLWRFDEAGVAYVGNFQPGDELLSTFGTFGPLIVTFAAPVARVGAQIQSIDYSGFTGVLEAFDISNVSLGSVTVGGATNGNQDNSAPFLGVGSTALNIASVRFSVTGTQSPDFAINQLDLSSTVVDVPGVVAPVPEPETYAMMLIGMACVVVATRRRTRRGSASA